VTVTLINVVLKAGPRATEYLGRKLLRVGIRKGIQKMVKRVGGTQLAKKITEKASLRLIVPGVNIPIAAYVDRSFTKKLGNLAIKKFKTRGAIIPVIDNLLKFDRYYSVLSIPLIYYVGIFDNKDKKGLNTVIEMQSNTSKRLGLTSEDEELINDVIELNFNDYCKLLSDIKEQRVAKLLLDVTVYTSILEGNNDHSKLEKIKESLKITDIINIDEYKARLGL
jgi:hypothetical protein